MIRLSSMQHRSRTPSQVRRILRFIERANDHDFNLSIGSLKAKPDDEAAISRNGTLWNAVPHNGPPRVNQRRRGDAFERPLCPLNQTNKSALLG
jgi:hypothetical protein